METNVLDMDYLSTTTNTSTRDSYSTLETTAVPFDNHTVATVCSAPDVYGAAFRSFKIAIDIYVVSFVCAIGLVGNVVSVTVLRRMHGGPTPTLLQALAVADTAYLLTCLVFQTLRIVYAYSEAVPPFLAYLPYVEAWVWPMAAVAQTCAVYMVVLVTVERWRAVCFPLEISRSGSGRCRTRLAVGGVVLGAVLFNLPTVLDMHVRWIAASCRMEARGSTFYLHPLYQLVYKTVLCFLIRTLIPLLVVVLLNVQLVRALSRSRREPIAAARRYQTSASSAGNDRHQLNKLIVGVVTLFVACSLPDLVYRVLHTVEVHSPEVMPLEWKHFAWFGTVSNLMLTINSAANFFIYCLTGTKFRQLLRQTYCHGKGCTSRDRERTRSCSSGTTSLTRLSTSVTVARKIVVDTGVEMKSPKKVEIEDYADELNDVREWDELKRDG